VELRAKVKRSEVGNMTVSISIAKILSQLALGSVKITLGELRRMAPDVFSADADRDQTPITLPLNEILARLNPALFIRRPDQKQVEVPLTVSSPFENHGQGLVYAVGNAKPAAAPAPAPAPAPASVTRKITPAPATPVMPPARELITSVPTPRQPPQALPSSPSSPSSPSKPVPVSPALRNLMSATGASAAPAHQPQTPVSESESVSVSLTALSENWPEAVRREIVQLSLLDAKVALPVGQVEQGLKRGRVAFTWKALHSWLKPSPPPIVSAHDGAVLELPLKVIAPLFIGRQKHAGKQHQQQKVDVDENIPNLFFGFPQGDAAQPVPAAARGADTNFYIWDDTSETARVDETETKRRGIPGTDFVTRYATPNEVVSRAASLEGVAGALIALPDGLMVANRISPDLNPDTLAAFLPQIFGKMSQCTKELRMGELNNLNFTVGNVPWKIFRVNAIFFAAFGTPGTPLPTAQLAALAAELDHRNK
jgi:predicted regulator of Ras-like GTPase activity (Roadblock/LC7/MglB family)